MPAPTYHFDDLTEPMRHIAKALETMTIYNPPCDSDTDDGETSQVALQAIPSVASRMEGTEDALAELLRITFIHTNMLKRLQEANAALCEQLKATTMKLDQMEVEFRALKDAEAIDFTPSQIFDINESGRFFHHPVVPDIIPGYDSSQWEDVSGLANTLAVAPPLSPSSRSSSSSHKERRPFKPHREEHVKRSRITYDGNGGQTPNILPPDSLDHSNKQTVDGSVSSGNAECDGPGERSVSSWLYGKATKALFRQ